MKVLRTIEAWKALQKTFTPEKTLGFVPTMGNLHEGHESLLARSIQFCDTTLLSIFINPTQFEKKKDLQTYPKTLEQDLEKAQALGVDFVFLPSAQEIYPNGYTYQVRKLGLCEEMEVKDRAGHFEGVLTVVLKLLLLVKPDYAYFGEKDYQQLELVEGMVREFFIDTAIVRCPTVRDARGIALSSRNAKLSKAGQQLACFFADTLKSASSSEHALSQLEEKNMHVHYIKEKGNRRFGAVTIEEVRLIDNISVSLKEVNA